jgi:hypothetical protein
MCVNTRMQTCIHACTQIYIHNTYMHNTKTHMQTSEQVRYMTLMPKLFSAYPSMFSPEVYTYERWVWAARFVSVCLCVCVSVCVHACLRAYMLFTFVWDHHENMFVLSCKWSLHVCVYVCVWKCTCVHMCLQSCKLTITVLSWGHERIVLTLTLHCTTVLSHHGLGEGSLQIQVSNCTKAWMTVHICAYIYIYIYIHICNLLTHAYSRVLWSGNGTAPASNVSGVNGVEKVIVHTLAPAADMPNHDASGYQAGKVCPS